MGVGDGPALTNASYLASHSWTNPGDYLVTFTAFNSDNPAGVSTNLSVHVAPLIAPLLTGMVRTPTNFSLRFAGQAGVTYIVERTANLAQPVAWQIVQTLFSDGGPVQARDAAATNAALFYRVRTQ